MKTKRKVAEAQRIICDTEKIIGQLMRSLSSFIGLSDLASLREPYATYLEGGSRSRSFPLLGGFGLGIKGQAEVHPIFEVGIKVSSFGADEAIALHGAAGKIHGAYARFLMIEISGFWPDTGHQVLLDHADAHLVIDHEAQPAKHLFFIKGRGTLQQYLTDAVR